MGGDLGDHPGPGRQLGLTLRYRSPKGHSGGSGWAGLSGAAVFSGVHLVAVVIADPQDYERSLVARRIEAVADEASLHEALGARMVLEALAGRERYEHRCGSWDKKAPRSALNPGPCPQIGGPSDV